MDAVHKRSGEEGSTLVPPRREDITDTMIFSPSDLVTMICRDVDLNYATRGTNKCVICQDMLGLLGGKKQGEEMG